MAKLSEHQSSKYVKLLYIGDSGSAKTGSLVSLVSAGYKLRILDLDNGLSALFQYARLQCPDKMDNVDFETRRDKFKASPLGPILDGAAKAYIESSTLMTKWTDGTAPMSWGEDTIFVLDSLTALGQAAFNWAKSMNPGAKDPRQWFFTAQQSIETIISMLTSETFKTNLIIISHVQFQELPDGTTKGYATSIGKALGSTVPKYFDIMVLAQTQGSGKNVKRTINTLPTSMIDLKNPVPFKLDQTLPLETGLATLFEKLKEKS